MSTIATKNCEINIHISAICSRQKVAHDVMCGQDVTKALIMCMAMHITVNVAIISSFRDKKAHQLARQCEALGHSS